VSNIVDTAQDERGVLNPRIEKSALLGAEHADRAFDLDQKKYTTVPHQQIGNASSGFG
jgi:hypothetical protein